MCVCTGVRICTSVCVCACTCVCVPQMCCAGLSSSACPTSQVHGPHLPAATGRSFASCLVRGGCLEAVRGRDGEAGWLNTWPLPGPPGAPCAVPALCPDLPPAGTSGSQPPRPTVMPPDVPSTPRQPVTLPGLPTSATEPGPQKSPGPLLTPVRANNQLGRPKCEGAARGDGDHLLLAQVALTFALRDGCGLRTGLPTTRWGRGQPRAGGRGLRGDTALLPPLLCPLQVPRRPPASRGLPEVQTGLSPPACVSG